MARAPAAPHPDPLPARGERDIATSSPRPVYGERVPKGAALRRVRGRDRYVVALFAVLLLAGCSSMSMPGWPKPPPESAASAGAWTRPGADAAAVSGAYDECLSAANSATQTDNDIDQDISASRASDLQHSEFAGTQLREAQETSRDRTQTILSSCMERKGFTPTK
jgi:hypothetical protein